MADETATAEDPRFLVRRVDVWYGLLSVSAGTTATVLRLYQ